MDRTSCGGAVKAFVAGCSVAAVVLTALPSLAATSSGKKREATARKGTAKKSPVSKKKITPPPVVIPDDPEYPLDKEGRLLATELGGLWTRDPGRLVSVLQSAAKEQEAAVPLTLMLAIAHAETNGRILLVSEAGAVGLAQATPIAYLEERLEGRLYVTESYVTGAWAYFLKKPLNDAERVTKMLLDSADARQTARAKELLHAAFRYRSEGLAELELLEPYAAAGFVEKVRRTDTENREMLEQLENMIEANASRDELQAFHDAAQKRYRELRDIQRASWKRYQEELMAERDNLLRKTYGGDPAVVIKTRAYEASEMLARELDDRFSPRSMASFLVRHLHTKLEEARALGFGESDLERMTAGLYNGGAHNVKRMIAGLIGNLPETQNYMRKVPATRQRLDRVLADAQTPAAARQTGS